MEMIMKKLLRNLILTLIIAIFGAMISSCSKDDPYAPPAGMMNASGEGADFCLFVPDDWTVDYSTAAAGAYFSKADPSSVSVMAWDLEYTDTAVDEWWATNMSEIESVFTNVKQESEENLTMSEVYGKKYIYTATLGSYDYKIMQAACIKDATVYLFTYTSLPENFDAHAEEVSDMLKYFTIKK